MIDSPQAGQKTELGALAPLYEVPPKANALSGVPLQSQTADLITILTNPETGITYKKAAQTTWILLKKTTLLLVHLSVTVFALFVWLCGIGFQGGHYFREWLEVKPPSLGEVVYAMLQMFAFPFVRLYQWAMETVKKTLGLEVQFDSLKDEVDTTECDELLVTLDPADGKAAQTTEHRC